MMVLLLALLIGIGISLFSTQNTHGVTITLANYPLTDVPLYLIVIISLLVGIVISFIMHLVSSLSSLWTIHQKDSTIKNASEIIANLKTKVNELEIENATLRETKNEPVIVEKKVEESPRPHWSFPFFTRLREGV